MLASSGGALLDFEAGGGEVPSTFWAETPTHKGVPVATSESDLFPASKFFSFNGATQFRKSRLFPNTNVVTTLQIADAPYSCHRPLKHIQSTMCINEKSS